MYKIFSYERDENEISCSNLQLNEVQGYEGHGRNFILVILK